MQQISIHDYKNNKLKCYYGSTRKVYRQTDVDRLLMMWSDLHYLTELSSRTRLTPANEEFLNKKAIPTYNYHVKRLQDKYPNIKEFFYFNIV